MTRAAAAAAATAATATAGFTCRCTTHCTGSPGCVPLATPLHNRWQFSRKQGEGPPPEPIMVRGDASAASARALQLAINLAPAHSTINISGVFSFPADQLLVFSSSVRVVGDGTAVIELERACMLITGPLVALDNLCVDMRVPHLCYDICCRCGC